ncbi:MAG: hypothetical protein RLZZ117_814 [Cyanobacteriota bacterium]
MPSSPTRLSPRPSAVVVGAGIAGLSAAFALAQRGFQVTVYEKESTAGGNLGATLSHPRRRRAQQVSDVFEVYPHMFGDWYVNFWQLMEAIGKGKGDRETWRSMSDFKFLAKPADPFQRRQPGYKTLRNNGSLLSILSNFSSGIIPPPDMFLAAYAALGLLADDFNDKDDVNVATLNDFLNTRFYRSKYVTNFYQMIILYIWSLDADESSVLACQRFFGYQLRRPTPTAWVLNSGDAYTSIIQPLVHHLQTRLHVRFHFDSPVVAVSLNSQKNRVEQLLVIDNYSDQRTINVVPEQRSGASASAYVFAVPPETLSALVQTPIPAIHDVRGLNSETKVTLASNTFGIITQFLMESIRAQQSEEPTATLSSLDDSSLDNAMDRESEGVTVLERSSLAASTSLRPAIVDAIPELATTKTFSAEPIPVLYVAFRQGADINALIPPDCYIGLTDSNYALTLVEITREFRLANPHLFSSSTSIGMIIALAASDYGELPFFRTPPTKLDQPEVSAPERLVESESLQEKTIDLLLEEAQRYLAFEDDDIEWCFFRSNNNHRLFLNDVESARNPVKPIYLDPVHSRPVVENLAFAGDFCSQDVVMSTVEAAVESGIRAAELLAGNSDSHPTASAMPLRLQRPDSFPQAWLTTSKLLLMPYAVLAKSCSDLNGCLQAVSRSHTDPASIQPDLVTQWLNYWPRQASMVLGAYQDAWNTMTSLTTQNMISSTELIRSFLIRR